MYRKLPNIVLGFHGCSKSTFDSVIFNGEHLKKSANTYDWLGNGIYFWEQNLERAKEWAVNRYKEDASVIGAVIDLGYCLNLTDSFSSYVLKNGYRLLKLKCDILKKELPKNVPSKNTNDILLRDLDCAVIQQIHDFNCKSGEPKFDSVRGLFIEGAPPYEGSEFREKSHIQLCICNPNCIKGYFNPLEPNMDYPIP